jgi:hypothetical protein
MYQVRDLKVLLFLAFAAVAILFTLCRNVIFAGTAFLFFHHTIV